jgi:hypothetical protein
LRKPHLKKLGTHKPPKVADRKLADTPIVPDGPCGPEDERSQVDLAASELGCHLNRIENLVAELRGRLEVVLRPEPPHASLKGEDQQPLVPLAAQINSMSHQASSIQDTLMSVLERLEL